MSTLLSIRKVKAGKRVFFQGIFLYLFLRISVRAFLNVDVILFYYLPKNVINDFQLQISSTYQYIAKFRSKCAKTKKKLCPELGKGILFSSEWSQFWS